jgi:hypothetical protein
LLDTFEKARRSGAERFANSASCEMETPDQAALVPSIPKNGVRSRNLSPLSLGGLAKSGV